MHGFLFFISEKLPLAISSDRANLLFSIFYLEALLACSNGYEILLEFAIC